MQSFDRPFHQNKKCLGDSSLFLCLIRQYSRSKLKPERMQNLSSELIRSSVNRIKKKNHSRGSLLGPRSRSHSRSRCRGGGGGDGRVLSRTVR